MTGAIGRAGFVERSCQWCGFACWYFPARGENWYCSDECRTAQHTQMARMRKRGIERKPFRMWDVWYRDGFRCWLCHGPVNFEIHGHDDMRASVDHEIRLADGGRHEFDNVRLAHKICNNERDKLDQKLAATRDLAMAA